MPGEATTNTGDIPTTEREVKEHLRQRQQELEEQLRQRQEELERARGQERPVSIPDLERLIAALRDRAEAEDGLGQVVDLTELKRTLDKALRQVRDDLAPLHEQLRDEFAAEGVTSKRHAASGKLVYLNRRIWARAADGDKEAACDALREAGLGDYVGETFNVQSLSAYFTERAGEAEAVGKPVDDVEELLPEELRGAIALTRDTTVGVKS